MDTEKRECQCPVCHVPLEVEFQNETLSGKNVVCHNCGAILWVSKNPNEAVFAPSDCSHQVFRAPAKV